jgi:DNA replication factor GINS
LDDFFQNLREIQKKERSLSSLSAVGDDFYQDISNYFNKLMERIDNNPFSFESYLLRDAQRIVAEICERREHKIANSVVMNVQRSYKIFKDSLGDGKPQIPLNSTPEEQKLYRELYKSLATYRQDMRSPLISYSDKKDQRLTSVLPSSKMDSKTIKKDVEKFTDDNINDDAAASADVRIPINQKAEVAPDVNEIPPEIQDEIYKEFGKEPSRQDSKKSSISIRETEFKDDKNASSNSDSIKEKSEINKVESSDNNLITVSKNDSGVTKTSTEVLMILDELPPIMGVDRKVYGPLSPGDIISMPVPNARILIKNHKGKSIQRYK